MTDKTTHADTHNGTKSAGAHADVRDRASHAYASSKATAKDAVHRATNELESNPLAVLVGGIAVGALAGALLPRSAKEKELLAPVGRRLSETARQALVAAKDAGRQELDSAGLGTDAVKDRGKDVLGSLTKALSSAGTAAAQTARKGADTSSRA